MNSYLYRFIQHIGFSLCLAAGIVSCVGKKQSSGLFKTEDAGQVKIEFAQGFSIEKYGNIMLLSVFNPWQKAQDVVYHYVLCPKGAEIPDEFSSYTVIYTPVERVVCLSTTHVAMLSRLGKVSSIKALAGTAFYNDSTVRQAVAEGRIMDIGYDQALNYEKIIGLKPDVIFAYGIDNGLAGSLARLADLGQTVVFNAEYLEQTALGKAEWIKFMAAFYDDLELASQQFETIGKEYAVLCELTKNVPYRPTVLCGLPWQGIWHIPGGKTTTAEMIADAGGTYLWKDNRLRESFPVSIEEIISKAVPADFWINTGAARTMDEIRAVDERLVMLKSIQEGMVYNNYARISPDGGNDFFESGVVNPHKILKDMIKIFHPGLLPDHKLYYYLKLDRKTE